MPQLEAILKQVQAGEIDVPEALELAANAYCQDIDFAKIDHHRALRKGYPEVVFCQGKRPEHAVRIIAELVAANGRCLATRASAELHAQVAEALPEAAMRYHEAARIIEIGEPVERVGHIAIVTAGTADIAVAEEAAVTAGAMGNRVESIHDVGVAGLRRLLKRIDQIAAANVVIVVAGMEGALASVLGGLIDRPLIGVPTSVGYGAHQQGMVPMLAMLNSCTSLGVVNVDNGFGAAVLASQINHLVVDAERRGGGAAT
jgi:NCAIR mutase (PurE)-related protein